MGDRQVEIMKINRLSEKVLIVYTTKPKGYGYTPGQAARISIDQFKWRNEGRYYAFAGVPGDDYLQFLVKPKFREEHVTRKIAGLQIGDGLLLSEPVGNLEYKGEGTFIAGGVGITPFISIFKQLEQNGKLGKNKLIYANKLETDILFKDELEMTLGNKFINILKEKTGHYAQGYISEAFLKRHAVSLDKYFYICGPATMVGTVERHLKDLGVYTNQIVK